MPKLSPKPVTVVGLHRQLAGTKITFSDGKSIVTSKLETIGWDNKLKEAPIILVNEVQYKNEVPQPMRKAWLKADYAIDQKKKEG